MTTVSLWIGMAILSGTSAPGSAADVVTLRDGKVILGQVMDPDRRGGPLQIVVRREWAEANLPDRYEHWRRAEVPQVRRAESQRAARLASWRRDRPTNPGPGDRITAWLERMLIQPGDAGDAPSPLMIVRLNPADVKTVARRSRMTGRLLCLGWKLGLDDVESMPLDDLKQAVEARGFTPSSETTVEIDELLPTPIEPDDRWLLRRAATEIANDPGNRLLRFQGLLLPEPAPGDPPPAGAGLGSAVDALKGLLGEALPVDPLPAKLHEMGAKGKAGVVVTELQMAPDLASVAVRVTLWVRIGGSNRWVEGRARTGTARPDELPADAGAGLAEDPQVKAAFDLIETLGLGEVSADLKQKGLAMGAATRSALARARSAIDRDLEPLALSLDDPPGQRKGKEARP